VKISVLGDLRLAISLGIVAAFLDGLSSAHGQRWGDIVALAYFVVYAWYCIQNFVVCGEVHCAITGPGFAIAAILIILRLAGLQNLSYALPWKVVVCTAIMGCVAQSLYSMRHGKGFLKRR
jgi:hypothetical protein